MAVTVIPEEPFRGEVANCTFIGVSPPCRYVDGAILADMDGLIVCPSDAIPKYLLDEIRKAVNRWHAAKEMREME